MGSVQLAAFVIVFNSDIESTDDLTMGFTALIQIPMWLGLLGTPVLARRWGLDWAKQMGWRLRSVDIGIGIGIGLALQLVLIPLLYVPIFWIFGGLDSVDVEKPAKEIAETVNNPFDVSVLVLLTIVMAPLVEEVFFRGLLQGLLQERFNAPVAVVGASLAFTFVHFQLIQSPALMLVGVAHGLIFWRTGRIGAAVVSHAVFNSITVGVLLA